VRLSQKVSDFPSNVIRVDEKTAFTDHFILTLTPSGFIKEINFKDKSLYEAFAIDRRSDIELRFGKADDIQTIEWLYVFKFSDRKLRLSWNERKKQIENVTITK